MTHSEKEKLLREARWSVNRYNYEKSIGVKNTIFGEELDNHIIELERFLTSIREGQNEKNQDVYDYLSIESIICDNESDYHNFRIILFNELFRTVDKIDNEKRVKSLFNKEELIKEVMHPNRLMKRMQYYNEDDIESFFENL